MNDDAYGDNTGHFEVAVSYTASGVTVTRTCWPGWGYGDTNHEHCGRQVWPTSHLRPGEHLSPPKDPRASTATHK